MLAYTILAHVDDPWYFRPAPEILGFSLEVYSYVRCLLILFTAEIYSLSSTLSTRF